MINFAQSVLFIYVMYIVRNYVTLLLLLLLLLIYTGEIKTLKKFYRLI
jgi:hypothetical protein